MKVKEILDIISDEYSNYEIRMSCMTHEYTVSNPESSHGVNLYQEDDYYVCVDIDWSDKYKTFTKQLVKYDKELEIISWDTDDGNIIKFESIVVCEDKKWIIIV